MGDEFDKLKKMTINAVKSTAKSIFLIMIPLILILVLLSGFTYHLTIDDGSYKEDDWSSTPYAVGSYTGSVVVNEDGTIKGGMTAQELWDKMIDNGSRVDEYLNKPEELLKLMNAELITNFPDLRENPDKKIDWEELNSKIDEIQDVQGIIKLKRADENGKIKTLTYVQPDQFSYWVSRNDKKALSHFTISTPSPAIGKDAVAIGDGVMTDISQAIVDASATTPSAGKGYCIRWVCDVYQNAGITPERLPCASSSWLKHGISKDLSAIPIGAAVYGYGSGKGLGASDAPKGYSYGHVGIYLGGGKIIDNIGYIRIQTLEEWCSWQKEVYGWGWPDGNKTRGTSQDSNASNYTDGNNSSVVESNNSQTEENSNVTTQSLLSQRFSKSSSNSNIKRGYYQNCNR